MVAKKPDDLKHKNQLCINMLHKSIGFGYPRILLTSQSRLPNGAHGAPFYIAFSPPAPCCRRLFSIPGVPAVSSVDFKIQILTLASSLVVAR